MHEASLYEDNSFITLTYNDESLPPGGTLVKKHFQDFMKRLRERIAPKIRFYHCGEYGDDLGRPHYHALIFNFAFPDRKFWKLIRKNPAYRSQLLEQTWGQGFTSIGNVSFASAAYVARYIMKKQGGKKQHEHYQTIDEETGEISARIPEYTTMSLRPHGIGGAWFEKYQTDVYPDDFVVVEGKKYKTPSYYDRQLKRTATGAAQLEFIKELRKENAIAREKDNTPARLAVRKKIQEYKLRQLKRELQDEA